jgi:hypothetical protein
MDGYHPQLHRPPPSQKEPSVTPWVQPTALTANTVNTGRLAMSTAAHEQPNKRACLLLQHTQNPWLLICADDLPHSTSTRRYLATSLCLPRQHNKVQNGGCAMPTLPHTNTPDPPLADDCRLCSRMLPLPLPVRKGSNRAVAMLAAAVLLPVRLRSAAVLGHPLHVCLQACQLSTTSSNTHLLAAATNLTYLLHANLCQRCRLRQSNAALRSCRASRCPEPSDGPAPPGGVGCSPPCPPQLRSWPRPLATRSCQHIRRHTQTPGGTYTPAWGLAAPCPHT